MRLFFGEFSLDVERRELRHGADLIAVEPQVFDLLVYLIQNRDRVVSKDDLLVAVWRRRIVSESTLTSRIKAARTAIGDSGEAQRLIKTMPRRGFRFVGQVQEEHDARDGQAAKRGPGPDVESTGQPSPNTQPVTFCKTNDGINLAIASVGHGPELVRAAHWATNIEYDWQSPITGPLLQRLAARFRVIRYDGRGAGLSDRNIPHLSFATMLEDLKTVIDASRLERFILLGISGGAATAVAFAALHPQRVSKLVLYGGYALGRNRRGSPENVEEAKAFLTMLRSGWGNEMSVFMRAFSSFFLPGGTPEEVKSFVDFQRIATTGADAIKLRMAIDDIDVVDLLPKVTMPTIVFHCIRDNLVPFEEGRRLAASIPNARFVTLESANHALLSHEPAWAKFVDEMEKFLADNE